MKAYLQHLNDDPKGKLKELLILWGICCVFAAVYGMVNAIVCGSISEEYFIHKQFKHFGFDKYYSGTFFSKWLFIMASGIWRGIHFGVIPGVFLPAIGWFHSKASMMFNRTIKSYLLYIMVCLPFGIIGFIKGITTIKDYSRTDISWDLPEAVQDVHSFVVADTIHTFNELGATLALLVSSGYLLIRLTREKNNGE